MILHLATFLQGGAGRCITDLAIHQRRQGASVAVITSVTGEAEYGNYPEYLDRLVDEDVRVLTHDSLFKRDLTNVLSVVEHVVKTFAPASGALALDVIHAHAAMPALAGLLLSRHVRGRVPVVQTMHGWGTRKTPEQAAMDVAILRQVDRVITTSSASRDLVRGLVGADLSAERVTVIPCGLPDRLPDAPPCDDLRTDLEAARARGARVLLCIGSVTENKNQRMLVEALSRIGPHAPVFCACIGEGPLIANLVRLAHERSVPEVVRFYGHRPEAARYLALADVLVLPSRQEGQGLAVLEAFRSGVLAVTSDTPALAELVTPGQTGLSCRSNDVQALSQAILCAVSMPAAERDRLCTAARDLFHARFTTQAMCEAHVALYAGLRRR